MKTKFEKEMSEEIKERKFFYKETSQSKKIRNKIVDDFSSYIAELYFKPIIKFEKILAYEGLAEYEKKTVKNIIEALKNKDIVRALTLFVYFEENIDYQSEFKIQLSIYYKMLSTQFLNIATSCNYDLKKVNPFFADNLKQYFNTIKDESKKIIKDEKSISIPINLPFLEDKKIEFVFTGEENYFAKVRNQVNKQIEKIAIFSEEQKNKSDVAQDKRVEAFLKTQKILIEKENENQIVIPKAEEGTKNSKKMKL